MKQHELSWVTVLWTRILALMQFFGLTKTTSENISSFPSWDWINKSHSSVRIIHNFNTLQGFTTIFPDSKNHQFWPQLLVRESRLNVAHWGLKGVVKLHLTPHGRCTRLPATPVVPFRSGHRSSFGIGPSELALFDSGYQCAWPENSTRKQVRSSVGRWDMWDGPERSDYWENKILLMVQKSGDHQLRER